MCCYCTLLKPSEVIHVLYIKLAFGRFHLWWSYETEHSICITFQKVYCKLVGGDGFQNTSKYRFCLKQRLWKNISSWKSSLKHWRLREIALITHSTDILQQLLLSCVNTSHKQNTLEEFCESRHFSFSVDWFKFRD